ncbi:MAG TPA: winged helix-turn-helix domain-containing protein [Bryobacteraceae bacterium]|nr:winged helix-turn-helix domain-containing protein [Bryobacteraceae bacterium]
MNPVINYGPAVPGASPLPRRVCFDAFELDTLTADLKKHGIRVRLQEQPFRILMSLLEASGDVVTREELVHRLWPNGTFVDFDRGLNAAMNRLRQVLGDSAGEPRFVETVARRGYRFAAVWVPVPAMQDGHSASSSTPCDVAVTTEAVLHHPMPSEPESTRQRSKPAFWLYGTVVLLAGSIFLLVARSGGVTRPGEVVPDVTPLTTYVGSEVDPTLSPDGSHVAFAWNGASGDVFHVYVQAVGASSARRLTSDPAEEVSPVWSPDGRSIAFVRLGGSGRADVVVASASGGAERRLMTINFARPEGWFGSLLDWHPQGDWIAASEFGSAAAAQGLVLISTRDRPVQRITTPPHATADVGPAFRPDGRYLAFVRLTGLGTGVLHGLALGPDLRAEGEPVPLTEQSGAVAANPAWTGDASELLFLAGPSLVPELHISRLRPGSGKPEVVPFTTARQISGLRKSSRHAGFSAVFARSIVDENIWQFSDRRQSATDVDLRPLIQSTRGDNDAHISPDGTRIVFRSARSGSWEIWVCDIDGANPVRLTDFGGAQVGGARWSPDGSAIALHARPEGQGEIYLVSPNGGPPRRMTNHPAQDSVATWSKDGAFLYFSSNRGGRYRLLKMPAAGGDPIEVTPDGGSAAAESFDSKWLYLVRTRSSGFTLVRKPLVGSGSEERVAELINIRAYDLVEDGVYYIPPGPGSTARSIYFLGVDGSRVEVARLPKPAGYGLSAFPRTRASARTVLCTEKDRTESDLFFVEGFR